MTMKKMYSSVRTYTYTRTAMHPHIESHGNMQNRNEKNE